MVVEIWSSVLSDLLVNLAAGWLGAVVIVPAVAESPKRVAAFELRRFAGL